MGPPGRSVTTVASPPELGSFPAAAPPSLRKSLDFNPSGLPVPITVRRPTLRSVGRTMSRAAQLLPVKFSPAAAAANESANLPRILRVAAPIFSESSQNTIRTPLEGALNGPNPSFKFFAMSLLLRGPFGHPSIIGRREIHLEDAKALRVSCRNSFRLDRAVCPAHFETSMHYRLLTIPVCISTGLPWDGHFAG